MVRHLILAAERIPMPEMHDNNSTKPKAPRTEAQKEAARANGTKSRGPVTSMGKATCSRNALRHGLTAFHLALVNEDQDRFNQVLNDYMDEYLPEGPTETNLVEQIAYAQWQLYRAWTSETAIYNVEIETNRQKMDEKFTHFAEPVRTADALESSLARSGSLPHLHRCEARVNRDYFRALKALLALRKNAGKPPRKRSTKSIEIAETDPAMPLQTQETTPIEIQQPENQPAPGDRSTILQALSPVVLAAVALLTLALSVASAQPAVRQSLTLPKTEKPDRLDHPLIHPTRLFRVRDRVY